MPITVGVSTREPAAAVAELRAQCGATVPRLVLCFASTRYDLTQLSKELRAAYPRACVAGCTTAGEIGAGRMLNDSVVAMFIGDDVVEDAACAVVENLSGGIRLNEAFTTLERHYATPVSTMDIERYVGLVLADGLSGAEEALMEKLGDRCDLLFVGGSAGDDLHFKKTEVFAGAASYSDAAVLLLLKVKQGYAIVKTQSFHPMGKTLVATRVDERARKVIEFNGEPALHAYAKALGLAPEQAATRFMAHPVGLMMGDEPYVRSPQRVDGTAIVFYCQIKEGMELELLAPGDIIADTRAALAAHCATASRVSGLIDFHCILRTLELKEEQRTAQYGDVLSGYPNVGFSTYGEAYLGHINQTSTILVLH